MKTIFLILFCISAFGSSAGAQNNLSISGTIKNTKGEPIQAASVFIDASQKLTISDAKGHFRFQDITPGTYQIIINIIGYSPVKQTLTLKKTALVVDTVLQEKPISLRAVVIGNEERREAHLKTFLQYFMGDSENAKASSILNSEVLDFSTYRDFLIASADDFLIIENQNLGYRIRYLLNRFQYDTKMSITSYDGQSMFEPMEGTPQQESKWKANRLKAYEGSMMHYLRSLYKSTTTIEGFLTYEMKNFGLPALINPSPLNTAELITRVDSNFIDVKYDKRLYVIYDKKKAAAIIAPSNKTSIKRGKDRTGSVLMTDATIDREGRPSDYKVLLVQGYWGRKRIGDKLPFEYLP